MSEYGINLLNERALLQARIKKLEKEIDENYKADPQDTSDLTILRYTQLGHMMKYKEALDKRIKLLKLE